MSQFILTPKRFCRSFHLLVEEKASFFLYPFDYRIEQKVNWTNLKPFIHFVSCLFFQKLSFLPNQHTKSMIQKRNVISTISNVKRTNNTRFPLIMKFFVSITWPFTQFQYECKSISRPRHSDVLLVFEKWAFRSPKMLAK